MVGLHESSFRNPVVRWIDTRLPIFTILGKEYLHYPMPKNANYMWSFGGMALVTLIVMILSGLFLSMFYVASTDMAFASIERIMRDVNYGWLVRYIHMNGASMFFIVVFIHMLRGLYYGSFKKPRELLWMLGVVILLLMMATAFMGYVLPWGQMSYWGATVITNLFSVFPIIGDGLVTMLWGGFTVDDPTLNRFFSLHYLLPFVILAVVFLHVVALHITGSNNPRGIEPKGPQDTVPFHPYMTAKDSLAMIVFALVWVILVFWMPNFLGHADNYIPADPLQTPAHIVPEWYFLAFYAMLRAIPNQLGGVVVMFSAVLILFLLPWLDTSPVRSGKYRPLFKQFFWLFVASLVLLAWVGANPPEGIYVVLGRIGTIYYFAFFLVILPLLGKLEKTKPLPNSISEPVLSGGGGGMPKGAHAKPTEEA